MALHFLVDAPLTSTVGDTVELTGAEAHHAATVRRVRVGERVTVGDGVGVWLTTEVHSVAPAVVSLVVTDREERRASSPRIVLVQALAKGDRDELAVQTATELGVDAIIPWQAARSVSRWNAAKADKGRARWASIAREAAKQAHRAWLPEVRTVADTAALIAAAGSADVLVLEPTASESFTAYLRDGLTLDGSGSRDIVVVVGPEGGIAAEERDALIAAGARELRLGDTVLRTSTAGPVAIALLNAALQRW